MKSICIVSIYFGPFPNYFNLWVDSSSRNSSIDFLLITDQDVKELPSNLRLVKMTFDEIKSMISDKIGFVKGLLSPYKLCDYKPLYGEIFSDYLVGYDFWGHCDVDLIWGDIRKFVTDEICRKYDKIFPLGHLSLFRNTENNNKSYMLPGSERGSWEKVLSTPISCVFDEIYGINKIYQKNGIPFFSKRVAADIDFRNQRMILAGKEQKNYSSQMFYVSNGKVLRAYVENDEVRYDEFCYIHLQKRYYTSTLVNTDNFIIGQNNFLTYTGGIITKGLIDKVNPPKSKLYERIEYFYKDYKFRIIRRIRNFKILRNAANKRI